MNPFTFQTCPNIVEADVVKDAHEPRTPRSGLISATLSGGQWVDKEVVIEPYTRRSSGLCANIIEEFAEGMHEAQHF